MELGGKKNHVELLNQLNHFTFCQDDNCKLRTNVEKDNVSTAQNAFFQVANELGRMV